MNNLSEYKNWLEKRNLNPETIKKGLGGVKQGIRQHGDQELNTDKSIASISKNTTNTTT